MANAFPRLFAPIQVGHRQIKNRIVSTPHNTNYPTDGLPNDRLIAYHAEKAKGGCGLVMMFGSASISPLRPAPANHENLWRPECEPWLRQMADAIHAHDAVCVAQMHFGSGSTASLRTDLPGRAASATVSEINPVVPHVVRRDEIEAIVGDYAAVAGRLQACGFDGCDLPFYSGTFVDQFWNPRANRRDDEYGGSLDNRLRLARRIIQAVRERVGRDFIVGLRLSGDDAIPEGLDPAALKEIARRLNDTGQIDYVLITGGSILGYRARGINIPPAYLGRSVFVELAAAMRDVLSVPVIAGGRVVHPAQAEALLARGAVDLVAMTRALMADPYLPRKAAAGEIEDIRLCMGSNEGCIDRIYVGQAIGCIQNPAMGREAELAELAPAARPKRVVVVGGGPGGLEAARAAARRGHRVTLFEADQELGGQVRFAARAPGRQEYAESIRWLARQVGQAGVDVRLGTRADAATILAEQPEALVVATGARPRRPGIPGDDLPHVTTVREVMRGAFTPRGRCLVFDEVGYWEGPTTADYLAAQGLPVEIVTRQYSVADDVGTTVKAILTGRLLTAGVRFTPMTALDAIAPGEVRLRNVYTDQTWSAPADTVILSSGGIGDDALYYDLRDQVPETYLIGDAMAPRRLHNALTEATLVARQI